MIHGAASRGADATRNRSQGLEVLPWGQVGQHWVLYREKIRFGSEKERC